jgi:hypothetical protein
VVADPAAQRNFEWLDRYLAVGIVDPEGVVTARPGRLYINETEPATLWQKETGTSNTGWVVR